MYEKDKLSKSRYQPLVKYLLTEDFSFQVRASENFEHLWIKRKGVHGGKSAEVQVSIIRSSELRFGSLFHFNLSLVNKIERVVDFKPEQFDFSLLTFITRYQVCLNKRLKN